MTAEINERRFYLSNNSEPEDAFLICGGCIEKDGRDPSLYEEQPPLPESANHNRRCISCKRESEDVERPANTGKGD